MYLFDARRLRRDLLLDQVSQGAFAIYAFLVASVSLPIYVPRTEFGLPWSTALNSVLWLAQLIVVGLGTWSCYRVNGGPHGRFFLNRLISLGWVVGVRVFALGLPLLLLIPYLSEVTPIPGGAALDVAVLGLQMVYFWLLYRQLDILGQGGELAA